jgi:O-6-methylguanine DNA methyltransferase
LECFVKHTFGKTKTYGEIAELIGCHNGARAVGAACGANPIPIIIPCHRVITKNGKLGGFSAGLKWKRMLLDIESQPIF